jgi:glycosyltransferase involved in cell wall biosynthesis
MDKLLSILVPVWNMEACLPMCLDSLIRQPFGDEVEALFVDDGSTDGSAALIEAAGGRCHQVRLIHQPNAGVSAARNRLLQEAQGRYIAWLDADDVFEDDWYEALRPQLLAGAEMVLFDWTEFSEDGTLEMAFGPESCVLSAAKLRQELADGDRIFSHLWSKVLPRAAYARLAVDGRVFDEKVAFAEDYSVMHRLTFPVQQCQYLHRRLYRYRQRSESLVHERAIHEENLFLLSELGAKRREWYLAHGVSIRGELGRLLPLVQLLWNLAKQGRTKEPVWRHRYAEGVSFVRRRLRDLWQKPLPRSVRLAALVLASGLAPQAAVLRNKFRRLVPKRRKMA